jgi:hypothetical protein
MTCISQKTFGNKEEFKIKIYEAPYHQSNGAQRRLWINYEKPFFNSEIRAFWEIYSTPLSEIERCSLSFGEEGEERRAYIKNPLFIAMEEDKIVGGAWINNDSIKKEGLMHIKILRENRKIADHLMNFALEDLRKKYLSIRVHWGPRDKKDDPSSFLKRHGFEVKQNADGGLALKTLK